MNTKEPTDSTVEGAKASFLNVEVRMSVINALMEQDRIEIRERQEAIYRLTYYVIPGAIAIAAFYSEHHASRTVLILGLAILLAIYVIAFYNFLKWLSDSRACLVIREAYYRIPSLVLQEPFEPIRSTSAADHAAALKDHILWFPFGVTIASLLIILAYLIGT